MDQHNSSISRERAVDRYVRALDAGNLDEIIDVLRTAEGDAELDRIIAVINSSYAEQLGLIFTVQDAEQVRSLIQTHLQSAFQEIDEESPLMVSEVTTWLVSKRSIPEPDQEAGRKLLHIHAAMPDWLSLAEIRKLGERLRIQASDRFWKIFRDAAIQMSMGRGQAQMTAARRKQTYRHRLPKKDHSDEEHNDPQ
jgi:NAD(P)-dependent dehydrogenase (short-subunit alcohol dehydrogenase family)